MGGERVELSQAQRQPPGGNNQLHGVVGQRRLAEGDSELGFEEWIGVWYTEMKGEHFGHALATV